ncbi:MAG: DUF1015 family protein [Actinomycetota bacterium]|jgi:uncharacterized protein (DUF1015 family)|nr:DUF1015 family protein [Actinomycetota bacterium]
MIHAVRAALLDPEWGPQVIPPPYDSLGPDERDAHLASHPHSFLHVARSAGLGHGHPTEHQRLAEEGDAALQRLLSQGAYSPREEPRLYVQRIEAAEGVQHAVLGTIRDGERKLLLHEEVHPGRVRALAAHFALVGAMSSPVVVTSRAAHSDRGLIDLAVPTSPIREVEASDGTRITLWSVPEDGFDLPGDLYVIDGHHRVAAASQARFSQLFVAYVPPDELRLDSFDRVVDELVVMPRKVAELLSPYCDVVEIEDVDRLEPLEPGYLLLRLSGQTLLARRRRVDGLDAQFVHDVVLPEAFGITQPSDSRLSYRPPSSTEGSEPVVISTAPIQLEQVLDVADAGGVMPAKSTYFVPKARSGLLLVPC